MTRPAIAPSDTLAINAVLVSARQAIDTICDRWSLTVILALMLGERRFNGLIERTGMASRLLTARLRSLEASGVIVKLPYSMHPPRFEYLLTNMGADIFNVIIHMERWEQNWSRKGKHVADGIRHAPCGAPLRPQLRCEACGEIAGARQIDLKISRAQLQQMPDKQTAHRRSTVSSDDHAAPKQFLGASLDVFGDKWSIEILLCAFFRIRRFSDFRACTLIAPNILSDRLDRLTKAGILVRRGDESDEPGYRLTEKGVDLYGVMVAVELWADTWLRSRYRSPVKLIHRDCGAIFHPRTTCACCEAVVVRGDVTLSRG